MAYKRLEEYGLIGNMHSAALVGRDGAIDWLCLPDFDSPAIFSSILDDKNGGFFSIASDDARDRRQIYFPEKCGAYDAAIQYRTEPGADTICLAPTLW